MPEPRAIAKLGQRSDTHNWIDNSSPAANQQDRLVLKISPTGGAPALAILGKIAIRP